MSEEQAPVTEEVAQEQTEEVSRETTVQLCIVQRRFSSRLGFHVKHF